MTQTSELRDWYLNLFKDFENRLNGEKSRPLHKLRRTAIDKFAELEFPDRHQEDWRFTDITPILSHSFSLPRQQYDKVITPKDLRPFLFGRMKSHLVVLVNGAYSRTLSNSIPASEGVVIGNLGEALKADDGSVSERISKHLDFGADAFTALNTAFTLDGAYINVPDGAVVEEPVHLLFISTGEEPFISQPHNLIITGRNSHLRFIEHYVSLHAGVYFTNSVTEIEAGRNSTVDSIKVQEEDIKAYHVATTAASAEADSSYESHAISQGARIYRHNLNVALTGEGAGALLEGLYLTLGDQLSDTHSMIDHIAPHCTSGEHYKGILDGRSRAVFNGKIMVRRDAQQTNSYQENRNVLLSNEAKVDTKPQLEIFADDVKCTHGATVGQLNKDSMFYLQSRGIGEEQAKLILIYAFANDVLSGIKQDEVRSELERVLSTRFLKGI